MSLVQLPSPLILLDHPVCQQKGVQVFLKREECIHPIGGGNKWRKLKYNLKQAQQGDYAQILTFGGLHSNHIAACSFWANEIGIKSVGIIRGEILGQRSKTLQLASQYGMTLHFVTRAQYRDKASYINQKGFQSDQTLIIPEGGSNFLALKGVAEMVQELQDQLPETGMTHICCACGTGGTLAGIISALPNQVQALGFSVLKGNWMPKAVQEFLALLPSAPLAKWDIQSDYHFGGYAKWKPPLITFMHDFYDRYGIPLDPIYTGKMLYGLFDLIKKGHFPEGSKIVAIHSGGLQGVDGFNLRFGLSLPTGPQ